MGQGKMEEIGMFDFGFVSIAHVNMRGWREA